jgi:hypothetical protein
MRADETGGPLSPILFDFLVDGLADILAKANATSHIQGLVPHLIPGGVTHLQYADDTMILLEPTGVGIANLKTLLLFFENMSSLKINFKKSKVVGMGLPPDSQRHVADMLNCKLGKFPITYLDLPISDKPLRVADWGFLPELVGHRVDPWQGLLLGAAGRLELTNSCLSSLPLFSMSLYLLHDGAHKAMDRPRARFF